MLRISPSDSADLIDHSVQVANPDEPLTDEAISAMARLLIAMADVESEDAQENIEVAR